MIDKDRYTSFIKDEDTKTFVVKNLSKIEGVLKYHDIRRTDFMDPYRQRVFRSILNAFSDEISYTLFGGGDQAERKLFLIYPNYIEYVENPLVIVRFFGNFSFEKISHRDCLGALMSLGLVLEKLGDIYLCQDYIDLIVESEISSYIATNITKIRRTGVRAKTLPISDVQFVEQNFRYKNIVASSMRVDVIIGSAFNLSRQVSSSLCEKSKVKVDFEPIFTRSKELKVDSIVSVRGYGRFKIAQVNGKTSKDKYRLTIAFYD